jgi:Flp pilus assembly protein TadG
MGKRTSESGQSLVEFALAIPVFLLLMFGLFDLGRVVYAYNTISNASRESVRVSIVNQTVTDVEAEAIQQAVSLGLTNADVTPAYVDTNGVACATPIAVNCLASVTIVYSFVPATPVIGQMIGPLQLTAATEMPVERTCPNPINPALVTCPWP